ncbi:MAG: response regulator, partial [Lachnospiraceae bacterium]|nr:response regulator [Lachnospiraceae bacterium]
MRILLAEDDRNLNKALTWQLTGQGYNVDSCYDGEDALYYGRQNIYDVILLDRMLPHCEGTEVLSALREHSVTAPVILITALGALKDKIVGLDLGADDYLVKPFDFEELLARIRCVTRRSLALSGQSQGLLTYHDITWS